MPGPRPDPWLVLIAVGVFLALLWERPAEPPPGVSAGAGDVRVGRVARVHDGDTVTLRGEFGEARVRLGQIDAPELGQPWGDEAYEALRELARGSDARLEVSDVDDYERLVGDLYLEDHHVNAWLVRRGHAWAYERYVRDKAIVEAEELARREGAGLWSLPKAKRQPPWDWRRSHPRR